MQFTIYNFGIPFHGHHYYTLCMDHAPEKKIFLKKKKNFIFFPPIYPPRGGGGGHAIYNFLSPFSTDALYQIWLLF